MKEGWRGPLEKIDAHRWRIPKSYMPGMRVPGLIYSSDEMIDEVKRDRAPIQIANAAHLPGIVKYSLAMPDIHWGYGLPIGGVVATDASNGGVISPGAVGYDCNCGVRLLRTDLVKDDLKGKVRDLVAALHTNIPCGVGSRGQIKVTAKEESNILVKGARWAVEKGYGIKEDLEVTEDNGGIKGADPSKVSNRAFERGRDQSGTLGSGNHFLEIQVVDELYDEKAATALGIRRGQITVMIHSGSRGFGHQICDDYSKSFIRLLDKYKISIPDKQLACAPVNSEEGQAYLGAMRCAANYAWNNRQCLMHLTRKVFERFFSRSFRALGMYLVYDVAHNIAKLERLRVDGKDMLLCVHRKGATRAFGPGNPELPRRYRNIGQPVIIPGDMGRFSYLLLGTKKAEEESFSSTAHGAGRCMSRSASIKACRGRRIDKELEDKGIIVMSRGRETLAEEQPHAYKDVSEVVDVVHNAGISRKVCRMRPIGVIKG